MQGGEYKRGSIESRVVFAGIGTRKTNRINGNIGEDNKGERQAVEEARRERSSP